MRKRKAECRPRPTEKFRAALALHGNTYAAAEAWEVPDQLLRRFVDGQGGLTLATAMKIARATRLSLDQLFEAEAK